MFVKQVSFYLDTYLLEYSPISAFDYKSLQNELNIVPMWFACREYQLANQKTYYSR